MTNTNRVAGLTLVLLLVLGACGKSSNSHSALADQSVMLTGANYCVSCALATRGATTRCDFYGHHHALRIESAVDANGRPIDILVGDTVHYLDNDESTALVDFDDFHGKRIRVKGHLFAGEHTLAVESVESL